MIIYSETRRQFLDDVDRNALQPKLTDAFRRRTGSVPADHRVWADEYGRFSLALRNAAVSDEVQVALEYHISAAGRFRVDVLLAGSDGTADRAVIVELKAWETARASEVPGLVWAPVGGGRDTQHPCEQARRYKGLILRFNSEVRDADVGIHAAAYLFNLHRRAPEPLEDARYRDILDDAHLFLAEDTQELRAFLERHLRHRPRRDVVFLIDQGRLVPAPALIERVGSMLDGNEEFHLVDEQYEAYQILRHALLAAPEGAARHVFIVEGGPGTGKSVIAVRLLADTLRQRRMGFLVAPNRAFRQTLIESLARGNKGYRDDGTALIQSSWSFHGADYARDRALDVLLVDEAHRLRDRAYMYPGTSMVDDMVRAARLSVFFVDETQRVTWGDTGGVARIRAAAAKFGAQVHDTLPLRAQFRCLGSDGYLNWLDDVLQIRPTANFDRWPDGEYEFRVFDRAEDLHRALRERNDANKARVIAGYAWDWPTKGRGRGTAPAHVVADGLSLPWNFDGENWATSKDGIEQVGCVHTTQGVEFDWVGVLIGPDLRFAEGRIVGEPGRRARTDKSLNGWKAALRAAGADAAARATVLNRVQQIIKNTYKVLLSRGRRGCFVWCADAGLAGYLRERLALAGGVPRAPALPPGWLAALPASASPADYLPIGPPEPRRSAPPNPRGWVQLPPGLAPDPGLFVARVHSPPPEAPGLAGAWCVFRADAATSERAYELTIACPTGPAPDEAGLHAARARIPSLPPTPPTPARGSATPTAAAGVPPMRLELVHVLPPGPVAPGGAGDGGPSAHGQGAGG